MPHFLKFNDAKLRQDIKSTLKIPVDLSEKLEVSFTSHKGEEKLKVKTARDQQLDTLQQFFADPLADIPQLFLSQINSKSTFKAIFGFKQRPLQSHFVTIVSACCWEMTADRQTLRVTTRLPVWGPFKVRLRTEWDVPEFAVDRWTEFVSKVNQAEQA